MLCFPNAKINIGLYVTARRPDGFHDLETVFYPVAPRDVLEIVPAKGKGNIFLSGKAIAGDSENNLAWKAYVLMRQQFPEQVPALDIYLHKHIPMGAGLGGGSSDGAFVLHLVNDFCRLHLGKEQLAAIALTLGSDCPFFIYNTPQYATGRGEKMRPVTLDLSGYAIQLVCPDIHVSTAAAFRMLQPGPATFDLSEIASLPVAGWKERIRNDFEQPVFEAHPELQAIKQQLYDSGAVYASMSGSGSSLYGIFPKGQKATFTDVESHYLA